MRTGKIIRVIIRETYHSKHFQTQILLSIFFTIDFKFIMSCFCFHSLILSATTDPINGIKPLFVPFFRLGKTSDGMKTVKGWESGYFSVLI
jgi:hypothetical protein